MRQFAPAFLAFCLAAAPAPAQTPSQGRSLMEEGMQLFFRGLQEEMAPALSDLRALVEEFGPQLAAFLNEMGPGMAKILGEVEDWTRYEAPVILPNGDILIRRKTDPEAEPAPEDDEGVPPAAPTDI